MATKSFRTFDGTHEGRVLLGRRVRLSKRPRRERSGSRVYQSPPLASENDWGSVARLYDLEHPALRGNELRFWQWAAEQSPGDVLELASGSGRVAIALARRGRSVTGLELSSLMLDRARTRTNHLPEAVQARLQWVRGDMANFSLPNQQFQLIFIAYNSFWLLTDPAAQEACLACVARHLAPGGRFILDLFPPNADDYTDETGIAQRLAVPHRGRDILRLKDYVYDGARHLAISDVRYYAETPTGVSELLGRFSYALRLAPPEEVRLLLQRQGFRILQEFGTYTREPLEPDSSRAIFVTERA